MDETYVGAKHKKTPIIGAVARGEKVIARVRDKMDKSSILRFIRRTVDKDKATLVTDENPSYNLLDRFIKRLKINHSKRFVDGTIHTNTIEGFWSLIKRAWFGQHHHYSDPYMPLYIAEAA